MGLRDPQAACLPCLPHLLHGVPFVTHVLEWWSGHCEQPILREAVHCSRPMLNAAVTPAIWAHTTCSCRSRALHLCCATQQLLLQDHNVGLVYGSGATHPACRDEFDKVWQKVLPFPSCTNLNGCMLLLDVEDTQYPSLLLSSGEGGGALLPDNCQGALWGPCHGSSVPQSLNTLKSPWVYTGLGGMAAGDISP